MGREVARPPRRPWHASTWLDDFAIVTWAVDAERVDRHLPGGFEPEVRDGAALISMVAFMDRDFAFRFAPLPRLSCGQVNYRTYVRRGGATGVWFFGSSLDSRLVSVPRVLWSMPWHRTQIAINATYGGAAGSEWMIAAAGEWGGASVQLIGDGTPLGTPPGFDDADASAVLFDPVMGWYRRSRGVEFGHYSVWHQPLALQSARVVEARCDVFDGLELFEGNERVHSAGFQRSVQFDVHTPPRRGDPQAEALA